MIELKIEIAEATSLKGKVTISGSKNATLAIMACSILTDELLILNNVPNISDVQMLAKLLREVGIDVVYLEKKHKMYLRKKKLKIRLQASDVKQIRASYYIMGALVAMRKNFKTCYPGGCDFAKRPIDYHLEAFRKTGYKIIEKNNFLFFKKQRGHSQNQNFYLARKSVGATINIIYISVLKNTSTIIKNPSLEPEVMQVITLLNQMKAKITILDQDTIEIKGVKKLLGTIFDIMSDRIEAGSYMLLACAAHQSEVRIENIYLPHLREVIQTIKELGVSIKEGKNYLELKKTFPLKGIEKEIAHYPFFPTDLQQILTVVCTQAITTSILSDEVYPNRLSHLLEIQKANGKVKSFKKKIYIEPSNLFATTLYAHDLRCGFACIVIGAVAKGITTIENAEVILRGYEELTSKLQKLGIRIKMK